MIDRRLGLLFCIFLLYPLGRSFALSFYKTLGPRDAVTVPARFTATASRFHLRFGSSQRCLA